MPKKILYKDNIYKVIFLRLFVILAIFSALRILFFAINRNWFNEISFATFLKCLVYGIRFDIVAIFLTNSVYVFLSILPFSFMTSKLYRRLTDLFFYIPNLFAIIIGIIDIVYFRYTLKRMTYDIFKYLELEWNFKELLPKFMRDFWYVILIFVAISWILAIIFKKISHKRKQVKTSYPRYISKKIFAFFCLTVFFVIGARGGLQLKPLTLITASSYFSVKEAPIILNTPFSIMKTIGQNFVPVLSYYDDGTLNQIYSVKRNPSLFLDQKKKKPNIIILMVESLSTEHIGHFNDEKGYTPFLDELIKESFVCDGYANGKRSIEALPSILLSLPSLMNNDFISSIYANNNIKSIADILKSEGYYTAFLHGGENGTMDFEYFIEAKSFDKYYGMNEFNTYARGKGDSIGKYYDGTWGIYDEDFLQYCVDEFTRFKKPFFAHIFTLSSHHPYKIPDKYKNKFPETPIKIQRTIEYTDFALQKFFERAQKESWFDDTLFIITADHTSEVYNDKYKNALGMYSIPIIFYHPKNREFFKAFKEHEVMQQIDIFPSILDYIGYDKKYFAFGSSIFDNESKHFSVNHSGGIYQLLEDNFLLLFDGQNSIGFYDATKDRTLQNNLISDKKYSENIVKSENFLKAILQQYNNRLAKNKLNLNE